MKMLIEYVYRGKTECPASVDSVLSIYEAAHYVQFDELFRICSDWLKLHVAESNCVSMGILADRYGDTGLLRACDRFVGVKIALLAEREEFLSLSVEHLGRILAQDELGVKSEDGVLIILQKWIKHDEASRRDQIETLSKFVRFSLIDYQESSHLLSDLDMVSHYHSSNGFIQRRVGCDGVLLIAGGVQRTKYPVTTDIEMQAYVMSGEARLYDASNDTWTKFPSLAKQTCSHRIVTSYGELYALGGDTCIYDYDNGKTYETTEIVRRYDAERRQWVKDVAPMSHERYGWEIVLCDNRIYGMSIEHDRTMCEVLDPETKTWIPVSSPPQSFCYRYFVFSLAKKIFAIGRKEGYMKYDPLEDRWYEFKSNGVSEFGSRLNPMSCCFVATEDRLYVIDGCSAVVFDSCNERFTSVSDFFPRKQCNGLAYALDSKTMYFVGEQHIAVYEERANRWDLRFFENIVNSMEKFECAVVDRNLMLNL